ncbi:MAG: hypothetical protein RIC84_32065 [Aggregatilineales bacterium]
MKSPKARDPQSIELTRRLVRCMPAATFEMETFCRLADVVVTRKIPTAAVECVLRPRLLINPDFAKKYCERDEHLFLLVMHELWHITLAHTRMYPRATPVHNIAFDAVINAGLSRQFPGPEYRGFFEKVNPVPNFPQVLLRPPEGWPNNPVYPDVGPAGTINILKRLYPPNNDKNVQPPFYAELLDLLRRYAKENGLLWEDVEVVLLGDHDGDGEGKSGADGKLLDNPAMKDIMKKVVKRWPKMPLGAPTAGGGNGKSEFVISDVEQVAERAQRKFADILKRCLNSGIGEPQRKAKRDIAGMSGTGVMPNARDRSAPAKKRLGSQGVLWSQPGMTRARVPDVPGKAYIYLDVSGSMAQVLPYLVGLLVPYVANKKAEVFQFSTTIKPLPFADLKRGQIQTTGGTNINCIMEHLLGDKNKVRRALLLTDGYTGYPSNEDIQLTRDHKISVHVVMPADNHTEEELQIIAKTMTILPSIYPGTRW